MRCGIWTLRRGLRRVCLFCLLWLSAAQDHQEFVSKYADDLAQKVYVYKLLGVSVERRPPTESKEWARKLVGFDLVRALPALSQQFDRLLLCAPYGGDVMALAIPVAALQLLVKDAFRIYSVLTVLMLGVVDHYLELDAPQTKLILQVCTTFKAQNARFKKWTVELSAVGFAHDKLFPDLIPIPDALFELLQDHMNDRAAGARGAAGIAVASAAAAATPTARKAAPAAAAAAAGKKAASPIAAASASAASPAAAAAGVKKKKIKQPVAESSEDDPMDSSSDEDADVAVVRKKTAKLAVSKKAAPAAAAASAPPPVALAAPPAFANNKKQKAAAAAAAAAAEEEDDDDDDSSSEEDEDAVAERARKEAKKARREARRLKKEKKEAKKEAKKRGEAATAAAVEEDAEEEPAPVAAPKKAKKKAAAAAAAANGEIDLFSVLDAPTVAQPTPTFIGANNSSGAAQAASPFYSSNPYGASSSSMPQPPLHAFNPYQQQTQQQYYGQPQQAQYGVPPQQQQLYGLPQQQQQQLQQQVYGQQSPFASLQPLSSTRSQSREPGAEDNTTAVGGIYDPSAASAGSDPFADITPNLASQAGKAKGKASKR